MKFSLISIVVMSFLFLISCSTNESRSQTPTIHEPIEIDIDEDGLIDYKISYSGVDIDPLTPTGGVYGISGRIQSYSFGKNSILRHSEDGILFLRNLEEIETNVTEPLLWHSSSSTIVNITTINTEGDWPSNWKVNSENEHSTYFLGLKINSDQLAWIEIEVNTYNGRILIVDKGIL